MGNFYKWFILSFIVFLLVHLPIKTEAAPYKVKNDTIQVSRSLLSGENENDEITIHPLNTEEALTGLLEEMSFYYTVPIQGAKKDSSLKLDFEYSELLLNDSSITVSINGQFIKSQLLKSKSNALTMEIPLRSDQLKAGVHEVTISFSGKVDKEICENDRNPSNWLTVLPTSSIYLKQNTSLNKENALQLFPYPFVQTGQKDPLQATIVIPDEPSSSVLSSALKLGAYLQEIAAEDIPIVKERELGKINTHLIAIGTNDQWEGMIKDFQKSVNLETSDNGLTLANYYLQSSTNEKQVLFVSAKDEKQIEENIYILTEPSLYEQLSEQQAKNVTAPKLKEIVKKHDHTFEEMNIPKQELSGKNKRSQTYFYPLPTYIDREETSYLNLRLTFSETLLHKASALENERHAELVVYLNDVPHSIALEDLQKEGNEQFYEAQIAIEPYFLEEEKYISIRFSGRGLENKEICVPPNDDDWIYVHEESFIDFALKEKSKQNTFNDWPEPFRKQGETTVVILPDTYNALLFQDVLHVIGDFHDENFAHSVIFRFAKDIEEKQLKDQNVILLGHLDQHSYLQKHKDDLLLNINEQNEWNVAEYHFLQETSNYVGWIQPSVWNKDHSMAVFSAVHPNNNKFFSKNLSQFLHEKNTSATVLVESKNGEVFTYTSEKDKRRNNLFDAEDLEDKDTVSVWLIVGFIAVLIIGIGLLVFFNRRRKREE